jgi:peptide/nickel transport system permease protein
VLPSAGVTSASSDTLADRVLHLVLPTAALASTILPTVVRFTRSSMVEVLHEDYMRTATSKGLTPRVVMTRHGLRNALIPIVSAVGALVPRLLGGTVVTEAVFGWPGMGRLGLEAAQGRDYPLVTGLTVVVAAIAVLTTLVVDVLYTRIDPRVRVA